MDYQKKIITAFELHSPDEIRECFENGIDPNQNFKDKPLLYELINMYSRGPAFKNCVQTFVDYGLQFEDEILLSVLLDNASQLDSQLATSNDLLRKRYSFDCAFTPLDEISLLHICAEYNHLACAEILIEHGADVNSKAAVDAYGFGGQTPIFHTVNQHANKSIEMLKFLISQKADLSLTVKGLVWGKGYEWETFVPAVNPLSYAMMGLLRQFQRTEKDIYEIVSLLINAKDGIDYRPPNVPNKYLNH